MSEPREESLERKASGPSADSELKTQNSKPSSSPGRRAWRRFRSNRLAVLSGMLLLTLLAFALVYPLFSTYRPEQLSDAQFQPPTAQHLLGTDLHGRDLL